MKLGVNIDHIAVLREARKINDPDPIQAIGICQRAGADQITIHLREDRRHIQDIDAIEIIKLSPLPVNLECATSSDIVEFVCKHRPHRATIVPEKRQEVTTEGGLALNKETKKLKKVIKKFKKAEVEVSLFIDPTLESIELSKELGADWIEFHTGKYANLFAMRFSNLPHSNHSIEELNFSRDKLDRMIKQELKNLTLLAKEASALGLKVAAGHGLNYQNVQNISKIQEIEELNIGQSIIARSIFTGLESAIIDMKVAIDG